MKTTTNESKGVLVTLPMGGDGCPVYPGFERGVKSGAPETAEYYVQVRRFQVVSPCGVVFTGGWETLEQADRFARSMGRSGGKDAVASECAPYWHHCVFGRIDLTDRRWQTWSESEQLYRRLA
jgi:hypothetical protein